MQDDTGRTKKCIHSFASFTELLNMLCATLDSFPEAKDQMVSKADVVSAFMELAV